MIAIPSLLAVGPRPARAGWVFAIENSLPSIPEEVVVDVASEQPVASWVTAQSDRPRIRVASHEPTALGLVIEIAEEVPDDGKPEGRVLAVIVPALERSSGRKKVRD